MGYYTGRGLRGSTLEELINLTNEKYMMNNLALIQKIPTPIKPIEIDNSTRHITLAYFEQKSTVDYIGVVQSVPVCFDAKECAATSFALSNVHEHQIEFMRRFEKQNGVAFLLIYFSKMDVYYYLKSEKLFEYYERAKNGGRKSISYEELDPTYQIDEHSTVFVHYLEQLARDLKERENN